MLVNLKQLADVLGKSEPTLREWLRFGMPVVTAGDKGVSYSFDTAAVIAWCIARELAATEGSRVLSARERLFAAQATQAELALAEKAGEVIRATELAPVLGEAMSIARDRLQAMPDRLCAQVAGESSPAVCHELIATECNGVLEAVCAWARVRPPPAAAASPPAPSGAQGVSDGQ